MSSHANTQTKRQNGHSGSHASTGQRRELDMPASEEFRENVTEAAQDLRNAAVAVPAAAREQFQRASETLAASAESVEESLTAHIREKPIKSMLIAAGVGILAGMFLCRR